MIFRFKIRFFEVIPPPSDPLPEPQRETHIRDSSHAKLPEPLRYLGGCAAVPRFALWLSGERTAHVTVPVKYGACKGEIKGGEIRYILCASGVLSTAVR